MTQPTRTQPIPPTRRVKTDSPFRVDLPPLGYLHPTVRAAAERFLVAHDAYGKAVTAAREAAAAVETAERQDRQANAETLVNGGTIKNPRAKAEAAERKAKDAVELKKAHADALTLTFAALRRAISDAAPEWAEQVQAEHAAAIDAYTAAATALQTARRDLEATGALLGLVRSEEPGAVQPQYRLGAGQTLQLAPYAPLGLLQEATTTVGEALTQVKDHETAARAQVEARRAAEAPEPEPTDETPALALATAMRRAS